MNTNSEKISQKRPKNTVSPKSQGGIGITKFYAHCIVFILPGGDPSNQWAKVTAGGGQPLVPKSSTAESRTFQCTEKVSKSPVGWSHPIGEWKAELIFKAALF